MPRLRLPLPLPRDSPDPHQIDINHSWCKDCDICSRVCPEYCLAIDNNGKLGIVDSDACTGCRLCELLCPDFAISIRPPMAEAVTTNG